MRAVRSRARSRLVWFAVAGLAALAIGIALVPQVRWRIHVVYLHLTGQIPDITLREVIAYMMPGSDQAMIDLLERRNPFAVVKNFRTSDADVESGGARFLARCATCHGPGGGGTQMGPALVGRELKHGESDWALYRTIRDGVPNTLMRATPELSETERWQLIAYIRSLGAGGAHAAKAKPTIDVVTPYELIASKKQPDAEWLTYSGSYSGVRHSSLRRIDRSNVHQLALKWVYQVERNPQLEVTPLVRNDVMFVSHPPCNVSAHNPTTGQVIWSWRCTALNNPSGDLKFNTRGVALLGDKVFFAASDARMYALNANTGKQVWSAAVEEDYNTYYISGAALAYRDVVVIGTSSWYVGRSSLVAYDANTGKERWRFYTVPGPGEAGHDTWAGDSWKTGGGPPWLTGSYDPERDLLYWGVGNPKPDTEPELRKGDNLYTNSVIALHGATGKLAWHFQFIPSDNRDWGANQIPVLVDYPKTDGVERRMHWANRNGFYYSFDLDKGAYLFGKPFAQVSWATGLDEKGRPILPSEEVGKEGRLMYPGNQGATHWSSPTYYPERDLMIVPVLEQGMVYFSSPKSPPRASGRAFYTAIRALNARTGDLVWERKHEPRLSDDFMPGLMSTTTGLVFGSDQAKFFALDANDGSLLWSTETGGKIMANPMTYEVNGEQYVTIAAGRDLLTFGLPKKNSDAVTTETAKR